MATGPIPPEWPQRMAPLYPLMNPNDFSPILPSGGKQISKPPSVGLDRLYRSEEQQKRVTGGIRAWECNILDPFVPMATEDTSGWGMYNANWEPDESKWFHLFRKSHWHNSTARILEAFPELARYGFEPHDTWSVDQPRVWRELSKVIDLASRILDAAAEGEWLQNAQVYPSSARIIGVQMEKRRILTRIPLLSDADRATADEVRQWLNQDSVHQGIHWYLTANREGWQAHAPLGWSSFYPYHFIAIDVMPLRWLLKLDPASTMATKIRYSLAQTLVHEVTHALVNILARALPKKYLMTDDSYPGLLWPTCEPFYGDEVLAECGHSHMTSLHGADFWQGTPEGYPANPAITPPSASSVSHWPYWYTAPWCSGRVPSLQLPPGQPSVSHGQQCLAVPGDWTQWIQSAGFWEVTLAQKGLRTLRMPDVLVNRYMTGKFPIATSYATVAQWSHEALPRQPQEIQRHLDLLWHNLYVRRIEWSWLRSPWYDESRPRWAMSPYSGVVVRNALENAVDRFFTLPRSTKKEAYASNSLRAMMMHEGWLIVDEEQGIIQADDLNVRLINMRLYDGIARIGRGALPPTTGLIQPDQPVARSIWISRPTGWENDPHRPNPLSAEQYEYMTRPKNLFHIQPGICIKPRHLDSEKRPSARHRRVQIREGVKILQDWYLESWFVPVGLRAAVQALLKDIEAQVARISKDDFMIPTPHPLARWLKFHFRLPPYADRTERDRPSHPAAVSAWVDSVIDKLQAPIDTGGPVTWWEAMAGVAPDPAPQEFRPGGLLRLAQIDTAVPYLTIGQLYDLQLEEECRLILVLSGRWDIEVYRADTVQRVLGVTDEELLALLEKSVHGLALRDETSERFRVTLADQNIRRQPLAKVIQWVSLEEVATRNGTKGMPIWITAGNAVYDITNLSLGYGKEELVEVLKSRPGGNPMFDCTLRGYRPHEIVTELSHLRIGMIPPVGLDAEPAPGRIMTGEELGWHEFKETGLYVQIYDDIYDVGTEFSEYHPGGVNILAGNAGRNVTELFEKYHPNNGKEMLASVQALKIGRIVKTRVHDEVLGADEIRLRDMIFDVSTLQGTPEYEALHRYRGTDATQALEAEMSEEETSESENRESIWPAKLWNEYEDLIVGKIAAPLRPMNFWQLQKHNGKVVDTYYENASFIAVDNKVMDVTTLMKYGPPVVRERLERYVGDRVKHKPLAKFMLAHFAHRTVARLSKNAKRMEEKNWDARRVRNLQGEEFEDILRQIHQEIAEEREDENEKHGSIELNDDGKQHVERIRKDKENYGQPAPVEGESLKRKREDWETMQVKTSEELALEFEETARKAIEFLRDRILQGLAAAQPWLGDAWRADFERDESSGYWDREARAKRLRV